MEEVKKKHVKSIKKSMKENLFTTKSYRGSKRQKIMGLVENGLLKEKKHYYSSTRPDPAYKEYEKCVIWRKPSIHLLCMWYC